MGANSRRKGYAFEASVRAYFKERGWHCIRHYQRVAGNETPDLTASLERVVGGNGPGTSLVNYKVLRIECKNQKTMPSVADAAALDQALASAGPGVALACVKRPGSATGESLVLMRLDDFVKLVEQ